MKTDLEAARREIIRTHVVAICDRNPPILSELEDRWDRLNRAFAADYSLHRYAKRFADHYDPLTKLSSEQCALVLSIETFEDVLPRLDVLSDLTQKVDHHIARLFELLSEIEVKCFRRLAKDAQEVSR